MYDDEFVVACQKVIFLWIKKEKVLFFITYIQ